jgi:hypothetical protein
MPPSKLSPDEPAAPADSYRNIPLLNLLREPDRRRFLEELTEAHYGKGD